MRKKEQIVSTKFSPDRSKKIEIVIIHDGRISEWKFRLVIVASSKVICDNRVKTNDKYGDTSVDVSASWSPNSHSFIIYEEVSGYETDGYNYQEFPWANMEATVYNSDDAKSYLHFNWSHSSGLDYMWSSDGRFLAVDEHLKQNSIKIYRELDGKQVCSLMCSGGLEAWSSDGNYIITKEGEKTNVYQIPWPSSDSYYPIARRDVDYQVDDGKRTDAGIPNTYKDFRDSGGWKF